MIIENTDGKLRCEEYALEKPLTFTGIGGKQKATHGVMIPVQFGSQVVPIMAQVVPGNVPMLISLETLGKLDAFISCTQKRMFLGKYNEWITFGNCDNHLTVPLGQFDDKYLENLPAKAYEVVESEAEIVKTTPEIVRTGVSKTDTALPEGEDDDGEQHHTYLGRLTKKARVPLFTRPQVVPNQEGPAPLVKKEVVSESDMGLLFDSEVVSA